MRIDSAKRRLLSTWAYLMRQQPTIDLGDLQVLAGFGALVYGVSLMSVPAAWMLGGALLLAAWAIPRMRVHRREKD